MKVLKEQCFIEARNLEWENLGAGIRRRIMAYTDDLMAVQVEFQKGAIGTRHHHPHRQISQVLQGSFLVHIGAETRKLVTGDSFLIPAEVVHGVEALEAGVLLDLFTPARTDFLT